ncbi:hypothetical protein A0H81_13814 [Grifola frondosa]|uniref:Uncharacterized protein n=1 Tax=Grifola frondosa TaxID=5627 RepID=A0A1C7LTZ0_GRIFR|nr:hypothetical protein A0H81_13814 [Grifola frondosa]
MLTFACSEWKCPWLGTSNSLFGNVKLSLPPGFTLPVTTSPIASPVALLRYHACTMAGTFSAQGIVILPACVTLP